MKLILIENDISKVNRIRNIVGKTLKIEQIKNDYPEFKSVDIKELVKYKLENSYKNAKNTYGSDVNIICEETGVYFENMDNNFPGALINYYFDAIKSYGITKFNGNSKAVFYSIIGLKNKNGTYFFKGKLKGKIMDNKNFDDVASTGNTWLSIFIPKILNEKKETYPLISLDIKNEISPQYKAFIKLGKHLSISIPRWKYRSKIFFIGSHKCGTTSFYEFMKEYGYYSLHDTWESCIKLGLGKNYISHNHGEYYGNGQQVDVSSKINSDKLHALVNSYDIFTDMPWPLLYKRLDKEFPGSKFILGIRSASDWIKSQINYFGRSETMLRMLTYGWGSPIGHEDRYLEVYEKHNHDVIEYFGDRLEKDLLIIKIGIEDNEDITLKLQKNLGLEKKWGVHFSKFNVTNH